MLTSKDLLYKALDYDGFWNTKSMSHSKPSQARKLQLDKLLAAFAISTKNAKATSQTPYPAKKGEEVITVYGSSRRMKTMHRPEHITTLSNFRYFSSGEFIADAERAKYKSVIRKILTNSKKIFPEHAAAIDKQPLNLVQLFSYLYSFRLSAYLMFKFSFGNKAIDGFSLEDDYAFHLRKKFMASMYKNLAEVDALICLLIDPDKKVFKEDEIGYPNYDLAALDKKWQNELRK